MNIFSWTSQAVFNVNISEKFNILPTINPVLKKAIVIAAIVAAAFAALWVIYRLVWRKTNPVSAQQVNQPTFFPPAQPWGGTVNQPWQPGHGTIPGTIPGQHGSQEPPVPDESLLDLTETEGKINKLIKDYEQACSDVMEAQQAALLTGQDSVDQGAAQNNRQKDPLPVDNNDQPAAGTNQEHSNDGTVNSADVDSSPHQISDQKDPDDANPDNITVDGKDDTKVDPENLAVKPPVATNVDDLTAKENKLVDLCNELEALLTHYPETWRKYLEKRFNQNMYQDSISQEIYLHNAILTGHLGTFRDNTRFIRDVLSQIDRFLTNSLFTSQTESCLQEESKINLIGFQEFFSIVDKHYALIEQSDPALALSLKIKLANLPLVDAHVDRTSFKNIYMDEAEQSKILLDHFQTLEAAAVDQLIDDLKNNAGTLHGKGITAKEIKFLVREVVSSSSRLSQSNRQKLCNALVAQMGNKAPLNWNDPRQVSIAFNNFFTIAQPANLGNAYYNNPYYYSSPPTTVFSSLKSACIARKFFETHAEVPRWYHATNWNNINSIINVRQIEVRHNQAYRGAWVSGQREYSFGDCVFVFKHQIAQIDPNVFIGYDQGKVRWRGLQKPIPLVDSQDTNLVLVGLGSQWKKAQKANVVNSLKAIGIRQPVIVSTDVIDYIQREVMKKIGNPNMSEKWWGKGDVTILDKAITPAAFAG